MKSYKNKLFTFLLLSYFTIASAQEPIEKLVILGSGPAGLTSAIYAGQANLKPLVIEGEECDGQLGSVFQMENFPGFPDGIKGGDLIERMHVQAENFGAHFLPGKILEVDLINRPFRLTLSDGRTVYAESMILASGTSKRWLGLESEDALKGKGVSGSATCDGPLFQDKEVVVVGGSDAALEEALALTKYASKVALIHRSNKLNASTYLQDRIFQDKKIQVIWDSAVEEILDPAQDSVTGIILRNLKSGEKTNFRCDGVFVSIGRQPNTALFQEQIEMSASGLIKVASPSTRTNIPGVFAAGDVADPTYRKAITASAMGCMAAMDAILYLK
jgi:thioredoxin reductase (NADPH)